MPAERLARLRHQVMAVGLVVGLISIGVPWISVALSTGAEGGATWADFSAASFSLALASAAAWGATLLTRPLATRIVAGVQGLLAAAALVVISVSVGNVASVATTTAAAITGVSGVFGPEDISWAWNQWAVGSAIATCGVFLVSGLLGVVSPGNKKARRAQYEQPGQGATDNPWDALSDGSDPTAR